MAKELTNKEIIELCIQCENIPLSEKVKLIFKKHEGFPIHNFPVVNKKGKVYDINLRPKDGNEVAVIFNTAKELLLDQTFKKYLNEFSEGLNKCESINEKEGFISEELGIISWNREHDEYINLGYKSEKGKRTYSTRPIDLGEDRILSFITGAAYYKYELFIFSEKDKLLSGAVEETNADMGILNPTHRLVMMDQLGLIQYLLTEYPDELNNRKSRIIDLLAFICGYKKESKEYKTFKATLSKYLNDENIVTEKALNTVRAYLQQIGIEMSVRTLLKAKKK